MIIRTDIYDVNLMPATVEDEIAQNVRTIVSTVQGTVPLAREFGVESSALDVPIEISKALLTAAVIDAVSQHEPRAEVVEVRFDDEQPIEGVLRPTVVINIVGEEGTEG